MFSYSRTNDALVPVGDNFRIMNKPVFISIIFLTVIFNESYAQQKNDSTKVKFDRIFGESKLHKYHADTLITADNRKVIYSGAECTITGFNAKGRKIWVKNLPQNQCSLEAFMMMNPLKKSSFFKKGCDVLVQYQDKRIYGIHVKTGKFYFIE
jgi:hypothetical protein